MVDGGFRNQAQRSFTDPLPEHHILIHRMRFELVFDIEIEYLQRALSLQCNDVSRPVHDGAVGLNSSSRDIVSIVKVNNHDLRGSFIALLSYANVSVALESLVEPHRCQLAGTGSELSMAEHIQLY